METIFTEIAKTEQFGLAYDTSGSSKKYIGLSLWESSGQSLEIKGSILNRHFNLK